MTKRKRQVLVEDVPIAKRPSCGLVETSLLETIVNQNILIVDVCKLVVEYCDGYITPALIDTLSKDGILNSDQCEKHLTIYEVHQMFNKYLGDAIRYSIFPAFRHLSKSTVMEIADLFGISSKEVNNFHVLFYFYTKKDHSDHLMRNLHDWYLIRSKDNKVFAFECVVIFVGICIRYPFVNARDLTTSLVLVYLSKSLDISISLLLEASHVESASPFPSYLMEKVAFSRSVWEDLPKCKNAQRYLKEKRTQIAFLKDTFNMLEVTSDSVLQETLVGLQAVVEKTLLFVANVKK